ncbi:MAG: LPXTG cell wall anchor domain-containing protein [Firmicutes bacterium]|nr:LPXTG cell wall anchor domain-containing protein [Bacillota bacterium]
MKVFKSRYLSLTLAVIVGLLFVLSCTAVLAVTDIAYEPPGGPSDPAYPGDDDQDGSDTPRQREFRTHIPNPNYDQIGKEPPQHAPVYVPAEPVVTAPAPAAPAAPAKELPKTGADMLMFIFPGIALVGAGWAIRRKMA